MSLAGVVFQPCSFKAVVSLCRFRFRNGCWLMAIQEQRGFKSCPADRSAATGVVIELLLKGFAGARNQQYLESCWTAA